MSGNQMILLGGSQAPAVDPFFYSVTSLLHGDGTNGGQNNTFLDSSTNNFTITRNGNTTQGSFSPFSQTGWGNYFNFATPDALRPSATGISNFGTGAFTVEFWISFQNTSPAGIYYGGTSGSIFIDYFSGSLRLGISGGSIPISYAFTPAVGIWYHVAFVRSSTTDTLYINGTSVATGSDSQNYPSDSGPYVGSWSGGTYTGAAYLSNVRVVKGTAVYTANFTPSLTPLTAISGTSLLTCQANRFLDASSNAFAITRNGDVSVQPFSPFNPTTPYSTSSIGGSGYFDGSGDYLTVANSSNYALGSDNFTIELWVYPTATFASDQVLFSHGYVSYCPWLMYTSSSGGLVGYASSTGSSWDILSANSFGTLRTGAWNHVALCRSGSTFYLCMNGVVTTTATSSAALMSIASGLMIGATTSGLNIIGSSYITNARIIKGSALYTTSYTPPTAPLTAVSGTQFLLSATNGAIFDNAAVADYETVGNAQISTSVKKYGTGSIAFDGTGDNLFAPSNIAYTFGSGDFTIEFWLYLNSVGSIQVIYDNRPANGAYPAIYMNGASIRYYVNTTDQITGINLSTSIWYHIAVSRVAGQTKMFVNGTQVGSTYSDSTTYLQGPLRIGNDFVSGSYLNGYVDDLRVSKGIGRYPYNFTPPTAEFPNIGGTVTLTADPYFDYTTLLLPGNGTNGAQNNTFLDSSTNNFTITRNGNTTQGTFSPFSQTGWGNYFDGSGDYLTVADNAALDFGNSDFTVEGWFYPLVNQGGSSSIFAKRGNSSQFRNMLFYFPSTGLTPSLICSFDGSTFGLNFTSSISFAMNQWNYFAVTRSGNTWTIWINGLSGGSSTNAGTIPDNADAFSIGAGAADGSLPLAACYLSNFRVVKGTAVYTANFTPPATPLTAITNTSLLTCQSNRFIDNSTNAFAITRNGDVSVQAFSPFNPTASWSAATYGGSGYFDGSGDSLYAAANAAFNFGAPSGNTNDFTVEMWVYPLNFSNIYFLYGTGPSGGADQFYLNTDGRAYYFDGTSQVSSPVLTANSWNHLALVRNGSGSNNIRVYGNGVSGTAVTSSNSLGSSVNSPYIGSRSDGSYPLPGYISSLRVAKGTAVYTAAFTPPTAPLTAITNTSLLTNYTNAGIYDATSKNDLETVGNAQISTTQSKFGGSSMYFDGTDDRLLAPTSPNLTFGTGDFTIEAWVNRSTSGSVIHFIDFRGSNNAGSNPVFYWQTNNFIYYTNENASGDNQIQTSNAITSSSGWVHLAIVRFGTTLTVYVNGIASGSTTYSTNVLGGNPVTIANRFNNSGAYTGYIDDLRITKGIARYTSNFTPPTTAFLTL